MADDDSRLHGRLLLVRRFLFDEVGEEFGGGVGFELLEARQIREGLGALAEGCVGEAREVVCVWGVGA